MKEVSGSRGEGSREKPFVIYAPGLSVWTGTKKKPEGFYTIRLSKFSDLKT
jgi:hypothetical protein